MAPPSRQLSRGGGFLEVIFPALDIRVKNVAGTYSLEHKGENDLFTHQTRLLLFQKENLEQNDQMFRSGWKDIFRMNQSELEAEIRKGLSRFYS
ncbi:hypothetical protein Zm00014a_017354 [Zea mays]|uniref:Uncharacterized protein n=1 Tax=Zea mays TaxID=4577 RepID=A0A3L6G832_MAIZE|nr:hypothetical protein Zm00014a_017354 [Zea mays]